MLTKSLKTFCKDITFDNIAEKKCGNFTVLPSSKCFPISYGEWRYMYEPQYKKFVLDKINATKPYFLHLWNKMETFDPIGGPVKYKNGSAFEHYAQKYCPKISKLFRESF